MLEVTAPVRPARADRARRRRSDAGAIRATARDLALLRFTGEQFAVTLPQLARLMGRSEHAARWLRSRWERAGWARGRALLVGEPVFVWLTRPGLRVAGLPFREWRPNPGALAHIAAVNEVRLTCGTGVPRPHGYASASWRGTPAPSRRLRRASARRPRADRRAGARGRGRADRRSVAGGPS